MVDAEYADCSEYDGFTKDACREWNEGISSGDSFHAAKNVMRNLNYLEETGDFGFTENLTQEECEDMEYFWDDTKGTSGMCMTGEEANQLRNELIDAGILDENEILVETEEIEHEEEGQLSHLEDEYLDEAVRMATEGDSHRYEIEDKVEDKYDGNYSALEDLVIAYEGGVRAGIKGEADFPEKVFQ